MTPNQFKTQLRYDIETAIKTHGGAKALSLAIGQSKSFVSKVMERNNLSGLAKLHNLIKNFETLNEKP